MISNGVKCAATLSNTVLASLVLSLFTVVFPTLPFRLLCAISIDNDSRISVHGVANASLSIDFLDPIRPLVSEELKKGP
jgi:hypothetical protein